MKKQNEDEREEEAPAQNCHNSISMTDNVSDFEWLFSHLRVICHSVMVDVITQANRMEYIKLSSIPILYRSQIEYRLFANIN